jgi:hypothetical protein
MLPSQGQSGYEASDWAIAMILVYNRQLSGSEITTMESWINGIWPSTLLQPPPPPSPPPPAPYSSPPVISGLVGYYTGESWTGSQWSDLSGAENHVTTLGGTISTATYPSTSKLYVYGNTGATVTWPTAILPSTYTLFHVTRYYGANNRRILTAADGNQANWLSGFWGGNTGVAFHGCSTCTSNIGEYWL